jgi:putative PIN family toxin of toxin-antitoxin system
MIQAVLDVNVLYSAILKPSGKSALLLRLALDGVFDICISSGIVEELISILNRPKARKELGRGFSREQLLGLLGHLVGAFNFIGEAPPADIVPGDPKDNHIVSAAVYVKADYLVSGDKRHILPLKDHPGLLALGVRVVTVSEFLSALKKEAEQ